MDTLEEVNEKFDKVNKKLNEYLKQYEILAEEIPIAEGEFDKAVSEKTLKLKAEGLPTTIIPTIVKGDNDVVVLKIEFSTKKELQKLYKINIDICRDSISVLQSKLNWLKQEYASINYTGG